MKEDNEQQGRDSGCNTASCYAKPVKADVVNLGCPVWNVTDANNKIILRVIPSDNEKLAKEIAKVINKA